MSSAPQEATDTSSAEVKVVNTAKVKAVNAEKRPPGRPRKTPKRQPVPRTGCAQQSLRPENVVELSYDKPMLYKRVFALLKTAGAREITMIFDKDGMRLVTSDRFEKTHFAVMFVGAKLVHYFCEERIQVTINADYIEKIDQVLDKSNTMISIMLKRATQRDSITFVFQNEMKIDVRRELALINAPTIEHKCTSADFETKDHEVNWEWPSTYFKKTILDIGSFTPIFTVQKNGEGRLTFPYKTEDNQIKSQNIIKDVSLSKLNAAIPPHDIFSTSVTLEYIKPIASAVLADTIRVYADRRKKMVFASELDDGSITIRCCVGISGLDSNV